MSQFEIPTSTVYGPVKSWRFGNSVGVDPILSKSTCSYSCSYCQLGKIQRQINIPETFIPTSRILSDFKQHIKTHKGIDVITFSGSGEPTLAKNLEEICYGIKAIAPDIPIVLLTNGLHLNDSCHLTNLKCFDRIVLKIDAVENSIWRSINRPLEEISLKDSLEQMVIFSKKYHGLLDIQTMIYSINKNMNLTRYCNYIKKLDINNVYINAPSRRYPLEWDLSHRGNHTDEYKVKTSTIKRIDLGSFKIKLIEISSSLVEKIILCPND